MYVFDSKTWSLCFFPPSALLDKGNKLRNAMVASAMKSCPDQVLALSDARPPLKSGVSKSVRK